MVKCQSCGGTYEPIQADGTQYFHRCAPLSAPQLQAAVDAGAVTLPKGETVDQAITRRVYERANLRDENLPSTREKDAGKAKAAGAGVVTLADAAPIVVAVPPLPAPDSAPDPATPFAEPTPPAA